MPHALIECVPNFSEGRDEAIIAKIAEAVKSVAGVRLLHVDAGADVNRTVMTFIGPPQAMGEAAFRAIERASQVIDMRMQQGSHPRLGATDVCPFVPLEGVTLTECAEIARQVARRVGEDLQIPVYLYEAAASAPERANLANIRHGEYEGLAEKMKDPRWKPDFGPTVFNPRSGATTIGAREFLVAYNITLNTRDKEAAADIAFELRERGRAARSRTNSPYYSRGDLLYYQENHYPCGNCEFVGNTFAETQTHCLAAHGYHLHALLGENPANPSEILGKKVPRAGKFKFCKAIGWYVETFRRAQISINLTNFRITPPHLVLEEARKLAADRGLYVTGSEIVGMIPFQALLDAGKYYLLKQGSPTDVPIEEILETAIFSMGLNDVQPFEIDKKVIGLPPEYEYHSSRHKKIPLIEKKVRDFVEAVSRTTPTPAGGSVAALAGALGAALASMAAKITIHKIAPDSAKESYISVLAEKAHTAKEKLLQAVDDDAAAYRTYIDALRSPSHSAEEEKNRFQKIQDALKQAAEVPYRTAVVSFEALQIAQDVAEHGQPELVADAALGCEIAFVGIRGSIWNIAANLEDIQDASYVQTMRERCRILIEKANRIRQTSLNMIERASEIFRERDTPTKPRKM